MNIIHDVEYLDKFPVDDVLMPEKIVHLSEQLYDDMDL